jgi:hypothetical protein
MLIDSKKHIWDEFEFENKGELVAVVQDNYQMLFGDQSIYFSSEGYVLDIENKKWYLIEVELSDHDIYKHIVPQITKQLRLADSFQHKVLLRHKFVTEIKSNSEYLNIFKDLAIAEGDVDRVIEEIINHKPVVAIPIDDRLADLESWAASLQYQVQILKISRYRSRDNQEIIYEFPDFEEKVTVAGSVDDSVRSSIPKEGAPLIRALIQESYLKNGQTVTMFHKGKPFRAIVSETGHLILPSGDKHSASIAAVKCIQTVNPNRKHQNGWMTWKTSEGKTLDQIRKEFYQAKSKAAERAA